MPFSATALDLKDKELLLYLSFNEGKGKAMEDLSPHGNDAELVGDADWVDGKFGKALAFGQAKVKLALLSDRRIELGQTFENKFDLWSQLWYNRSNSRKSEIHYL